MGDSKQLEPRGGITEHGNVICGGFVGDLKATGNKSDVQRKCDFCDKPYGLHAAKDTTAAVRWNEAVDSPLPMGTQGSTDARVSVTTGVRVDRHYPLVLTRWTSFIEEASKFKVPNEKSDWKETMEEPMPFLQEGNVWSTLQQNVANFFYKSSLGSVALRGKAVSSTKGGDEEKVSSSKRAKWTIGEPDFIALSKAESVIGVIEAKVPWATDLTSSSYMEKYNTRSLAKKDAEPIAQTIGYMLDNKVRYGALTTYNETRFFRAISVDNVQVSEVVIASSITAPGSITLRRAFAYWLQLCQGDDSFFEGIPVNQRRLSGEKVGSPPGYMAGSGVYNGDGSCNSTPSSSSSSNSSSSSSSSSSNSSSSSSNSSSSSSSSSSSVFKSGIVNPVHRSLYNHPMYVEWTDLEFFEGLGNGRCGTVVMAVWKGRKIALKMVDVGKYGFISFDNELRVYTSLIGKNVKVVKLLFVTSSPSGQVFALGLQLGQPMPPLAMWSEPQRRSALRALQSLLDEASLLQNDLREQNFVRDVSGDLLLVDMEDTSTSVSEIEGDMYMSAARAYFCDQ